MEVAARKRGPRPTDNYRGARRNFNLRLTKAETLRVLRLERPELPRQRLVRALWPAPRIRPSKLSWRLSGAYRVKGKFDRHIIRTEVVANWREFKLHATKGWRSYRLTNGAQHLRRLAA